MMQKIHPQGKGVSVVARLRGARLRWMHPVQHHALRDQG